MSDTGCANRRALAQTRPSWNPFKCLVLGGDAKCDKEGISCYDTKAAEKRQKTNRLMSILAFHHLVFFPLQHTQLIINVKSPKIKLLCLQVSELFGGGIQYF